ncbi:anhydro-N-acetylmuramic acid kinase [Neorhizobium sp. T786]|uniref:anhydro-N-acetylmuramic acid kinase n=1 Tax=Pseudorhizobium xiangyangii TaxID=2883104 RepID=UPI001CFFBFCB|nr:anhydro-N-acetylmuramic acid kinase [Neorhizobium xiangyangii]MCB5204135.1 anhydro-N-acetylmuramic acid kinase [Neorhizobium xiangyangii]
MGEMKTAIGLMSGTSMDGIDVALVRTDGSGTVVRGPFMGVPYEAAFRDRLKQALVEAKDIGERSERPGALGDVERELTLRHADAVRIFLERNSMAAEAIDVIGFHGQTVLHRPDRNLTVQIGDGALLGDRTGIPVVYDMRANDMRHGGQGAPLVPAYHAALAKTLPAGEGPVCFVNIGGISNLTYIGTDGALIAYDSGPGNALIDQWVETHAGIPFDQGGMIASEGRVVPELADSYLGHPFFTDKVRRSLDRNDFLPPSSDKAELADGARTLAYVAAASILQSAKHLPARPALYVICGGGRLNKILMNDIANLAAGQEARILTAEDAGFDGDAMEAEAWGYLAVRSMLGLPLTYPCTTGVARAMTGGSLYGSARKNG